MNMLTSVRGLFAATLFAGAALAATPAFADDAGVPSDITISGNASLVTEYRFRGVDLSGGDIAVQGGVDISHSSGFYVGTWGSSLDEDTVGYGHTELDLYGGWSGEIASGVSGDIGVLYYAYPNAPAGDYDYVEFYGSLSKTLGPVDATVGVAYAPKQDSLGGTDNFYVYSDLGVAVPNTPVSLKGHIGYTDGFLTYTNDGTAFDWSIGAEFAVNSNLSVGVSYVDAQGNRTTFGDGSTYNFVDGAVVGSLSVSF
ncbi:putative uncharacterized protein [Novosphingobium sp. PY1]|nr:putative uncharacterized protein [Novosphingobium sp. PY1]